MSRLEELINELCPDGVEYKPLWSITIWDKKFNGVDKNKQLKVIKYPYLLASDANKLLTADGDIYYLNTGIDTKSQFADEILAKDYICEGEIVAIPWGGTPNVKYYKGKFITGDNRIATSSDLNILNNKFLYYYLSNQIDLISTFYRGSGIKHPDMSKVLNLEIPVPPLPIQEEIVRILDNFTELTNELTNELEFRKKQYEWYRDKLLLNPEYPLKEIKTFGRVSMCKRILKAQTSSEGDIPFYKIGTFGKQADAFIDKELFLDYSEKFSYPKKGDILISCSGTIGRTVIFDGKPSYFQDSNIVWVQHDNKIVLNKFLYYVYQLNPWRIENGGTISRLYNDNILNTKIPIPTLEEQQRIVDILDKFDVYCNDLTQGLPAEIELRKKQYEYYRDKLLTFKRLEEK